MMNDLHIMIVAWGVFTGLFLALLAYNGTITRYEENQLFLAETNENEQQEQTVIARRVNKIQPFIRIFGVLSGLMTLLIIGVITWDAWQKIH